MSESEEMYLVSIAKANEGGQDPVPLTYLANELNVQPVSANQMIKKLEEAGKVVYTPYKGVAFTPPGKAEAARILRQRRLWEVFLAEHLGYTPSEADEIACRLEHLVETEVSERLAAFLGSPKTSPQGKSIPGPETDGDEPELDSPLTMIAGGSSVTITAITTGETEKSFLRRGGVILGAKMTVLAIQATGACLVEPDSHPVIQISAQIANQIRVRAESISK